MTTPTTNRLLDLVETAQSMIDAAAAVTTGRLQLTSPDEALERLAAGNAEAIACFRFELARQVASALVMMDPNVIAVFEDREQSDADREAQPAPRLEDPLRLWVQVRYRTAALSTVIDALNQALEQALTRVSENPPGNLIATVIVDDDDNRLVQVGSMRPGPAPKLLVRR